MMPKRVLDGPGLWRSEKIRRVDPVRARPEFANLLPLALANGVFEADPDRIWADVYSFNRPDIKPADVRRILEAFERVKLLFRWTDETGKVWGYWVGIEKPGRLPGKSRRGKNEAIGPEPPEEGLRAFLNVSMDSNGIHKLPGFGSGSGSGKEGAPNSGAPAAQAESGPSPLPLVETHLKVSEQQERSSDARFQPIVKHYFTRSRAAGVEPDFDKGDGKEPATGHDCQSAQQRLRFERPLSAEVRFQAARVPFP
jgi:hypothetical protein